MYKLCSKSEVVQTLLQERGDWILTALRGLVCLRLREGGLAGPGSTFGPVVTVAGVVSNIVSCCVNVFGAWPRDQIRGAPYFKFRILIEIRTTFLEITIEERA